MKEGVKYYNGNRIDPVSQQILVLIDDSPKPVTNAELAHELDEERGSIHYRLRTHLISAGLIEETDAPGRPYKDGPFYDLAPSGTMWVNDARDKFARPKTVSEISEAMREAQKKAENANDRVDKTRKHRYKLKQELEEKIEESQSRPEGGVSHEDMVDYYDMQSKHIRQDIDARASRLEAQIDTLGEDIGELEEALAQVNQRAHANAEDIQGLDEEVGKARNSFFLVQDRIDDLERKIEPILI